MEEFCSLCHKKTEHTNVGKVQDGVLSGFNILKCTKCSHEWYKNPN